MKAFIAKVAKIQQSLNAPKNQYNSFGKYPYRNLEDILEAAKRLLGDLVLTINDDIAVAGDRVYVKAVATITDGEHSITNTGFAREAMTKKGMDESQITGSTSSYARKYAVAGLFLCDDNKDADSQDNNQQAAPKQSKPIDHSAVIKQYTDGTKEQRDALWNSITPDQQIAINEALS
jgi:hypothetical protein